MSDLTLNDEQLRYVADAKVPRHKSVNLLRGNQADKDQWNATRALVPGVGLLQMPTVDLSRENLAGANLQQVNLDRVVLDGADLRGSDLRRSRWMYASARGADFRGANLVDACLADTDCSNADFRGIGLNFTPNQLSRAKLDNARMDRASVEASDLPLGVRYRMRIEDGLAELQQAYSGFWSSVHLLALIAFLFPYVVFCWRQYMVAEWSCPGGSCEPLYAALWHFIKTAGKGGNGVVWSAFVPFWVTLAYNGLRAVLLWKTKQLELIKSSTGMHPTFTLVGKWGLAFTLAGQLVPRFER